MAGISFSHISRMEAGQTDVSRPVLAQLAAALNTTVEELQGEAPLPAQPTAIAGALGPEETQVVLALRKLKKDDQRAVIAHAHGLGLLQEQMRQAEHAIKSEVLLPLDPRGTRDVLERRVLVRMVGYVAAGTADLNGDELNDEVEIPADLWRPGREVVTARGYSLVLDGILDGDLLIIERAEFNYNRGDRVIAAVLSDGQWGMVVKLYGGQRKGVITLKSANPSVGDIIGKTGEEIEIRAIVRHVWRS